MDLKKITSHRALAAALIVLAAAVYLPTLSGGFIWDDLDVFLGKSEYVPFFENSYQRPFYEATMVMDHRIWGENPLGFHITNVVLHAASSVLVLVLGLYLLEGALLPFLAALLFALHPVNTEAVAWVPARAELLMSTFFLAAFILYLQYKKEGKTAALIASMLFFLLSALSRQAAIIFPLVILAYETAVKAGALDRKKLLFTAGFVALPVAGYLVFFRGAGEFFPPGGFALKQLFNSLSALGYYAVKFAVPLHLNFLPAVPSSILYAIIGLLPLGAAATLFYEGKKRPAFLLAWIIITLLPSVLTAMAFAVDFPVGERFLYLPSAGFCLLLAAAAGAVKNKKIIASVFIPVLALYMAGTLDRALTWGDPAALWQDTALKNPDHILPGTNYVAALVKNGSLPDEGKKALETVLRQGKMDQREVVFVMKLFGKNGGRDAETGLFEVLQATKGEAEANYGIGFMYYSLYKEERQPESLEKAVHYLNNAIAASSDYVLPHYYLGLSHFELGDWVKAEEELKLTRELDPDGRYREDADDILKIIEMFRERGLLNR
jgi:tetratricopeptide (TPR) repeat protein